MSRSGEHLSTADLLLAPKGVKSMALVPRRDLGISYGDALTSDKEIALSEPPESATLRVWQEESIIAPRASSGAYLAEGRVLAEVHSPEDSLEMVIRDGEGNELYFWRSSRDGSTTFFVSDSSERTPPPPGSKQVPMSPAIRLPRGAFLLDAQPLDIGCRIIWVGTTVAEQEPAEHELFVSKWTPGEGRFALADSITSAFHGGQSKALLGEEFAIGSFSLQTAGSESRFAWLASESGKRHVKHLTFSSFGNTFSSQTEQRYLSGPIEESGAVVVGKLSSLPAALVLSGGDSSGMPGEVVSSVSGVTLFRSGNHSGTRLVQTSVLESSESVSLATLALRDGFALAWSPEQAGALPLCFARFEGGSSEAPVRHHYDGDEMFVRSPDDFLLLRDESEIYLLWLERQEERARLWALAWGGDAPEVLEPDLSPDCLLRAALGGKVLLWEPSLGKIALASITNKGLRGEEGSRMGESV